MRSKYQKKFYGKSHPMVNWIKLLTTLSSRWYLLFKFWDGICFFSGLFYITVSCYFYILKTLKTNLCVYQCVRDVTRYIQMLCQISVTRLNMMQQYVSSWNQTKSHVSHKSLKQGVEGLSKSIVNFTELWVRDQTIFKNRPAEQTFQVIVWSLYTKDRMERL